MSYNHDIIVAEFDYILNAHYSNVHDSVCTKPRVISPADLGVIILVIVRVPLHGCILRY